MAEDRKALATLEDRAARLEDRNTWPIHRPRGQRTEGGVPIAREVREKTQEFFVLDPDVKELGGVRVQQKGNDRVVAMTAAQADYWIEQGALGAKAGNVRTGAALGIKKRKDGEKPRPQRRVEAPPPEEPRPRRR